MYETKERYHEIVMREVVALERNSHNSITHGELGCCPRCGKIGTWDIASKGFNYSNSIYYSTVFYDWRCRNCDTRKFRSFSRQHSNRFG